MQGVEKNLSAIPYLNCFGISVFLEGVKTHLGKYTFRRIAARKYNLPKWL